MFFMFFALDTFPNENNLENQIKQAETFLRPDSPLDLYAERYLSFLLQGDRQKAQQLVHGLVKQNYGIPDIYEHIFQATQYQIGFLWQTKKITVAHEHYCTAATQLIMSTLYAHIFDSPKKGRKFLACAVSDDLHEMGIRMISDMFELDGWDTYYMGANMPDVHILTAINEQQPDVIGISATMPSHVGKAAALIEKVRSACNPAKFKILVGGYPFSLEPLLWNRIGADGSAKDAKEAVRLANNILAYKPQSNVQSGTQ
jgi:methanogenic corrinoid protein MtbC1